MRGVVLACFLIAAATGSAGAADLAAPSVAEDLPTPVQSVRDYVDGRALLHTLRALFDVEAVGDLPALVASDADAVANGVTEEQSRDLEVALITEGSYFLTSLQYLIDAGFPNWPQDRDPSTYERDSRMMLENLPEQLIETVLSGDDPIAIFTTASEIYWWTEGEEGPVDGRPDFAQRDALVDAALAQSAPEKASL
jgi:hypothetical protein